MSDVRERLERLGVLPGATEEEPAEPEPTPVDAVQAFAEAVEVPTEHGPGVCIEGRFPLESAHGGVRLSDLDGPVGHPLATLAGADLAVDADLADALFLDVESTGLGAGAGTYAFLVGVARVEAAELRLRQYFLRGPEAEPALVDLLSGAIEGAKLLVTFNGRSFDLPLLHTRFILQQRILTLLDVPHLDLIGPCRRLWRYRFGSYSLGSLEENLFGLTRTGDVPGREIPALYQTYLQTGDATPLVPVVSHNALDVLSLASLAIRIRSTLVARDPRDLEHAADWLGVGRSHEVLGDLGRAEQAYWYAVTLDAPEQALAGDEDGEAAVRRPRYDAYRALSRLAKRQHRWPEATRLWQDLVEAAHPDGLYPYEELAKHREHRERRFDEALALVETALGRLDQGELVCRRPRERLVEELEHRRARLERKRRR